MRSAAGATLLLTSLAPAVAGDMPEACDAKDPPSNKPFDVHVSTEFATDYIYRGVTLSAHQPALGATMEFARGPFYFKFEPHGVKLPTNPSAELGFSGGWCREVVKNIKVDFGLAYIYYPGEVAIPPVISTSYLEAHATVSYDHPSEFFTLTGTYAYSPNYSNTGAWEHYSESGFELHMEKIFPRLLPKDIEWAISASVGRSWFGPQSPSSVDFRCRVTPIGRSAFRSTTNSSALHSSIPIRT